MKILFNKKFLGVFAGAVLLLGAGTAHASSLTQSQIQAVISLLQAFNANQSTIFNVSSALNGSVSSPFPTPTVCPALTLNLYRGLTDSNTSGQVSQLQQYLGIPPVGIYGPVTASRVAALQAQYALYPVTGGVGPLTRALIQRLCGGGYPTPTPTPTGNSFIFNSQFTVFVGQLSTESSLGQLSVQLLSVNGSTAQVTLGENCQRGTQCFFFPTQTVVMSLNQPINFQNYTITLTGISGSSATFYATRGSTTTVVPSISSIQPTSGAVGSTITIFGTGFAGDNVVHFGVGGQQHIASQNNGTAITFTIPQQVGPCDLIIPGQQVCATFLQLVQPGTYNISVSNANGQSQTMQFSVTSGQVGSGAITLTQPQSGQVFARGQTLPIAWSISGNVPTSASVILDLYSEAGSNIGTFAIANSANGSTSWSIPGFPQNIMCTQQYPNGLCGVSIPTGRYYVKATLTSDGFNPTNATTYGVSQSGLFTINSPVPPYTPPIDCPLGTFSNGSQCVTNL